MTDEFISDGVESGTTIVHGGENFEFSEFDEDKDEDDYNHDYDYEEQEFDEEQADKLKERRKLVTRVIFLLNITKIEEHACEFVAKLVVVEIPEGVESIGFNAFGGCECLTTVSFPTTLTSTGMQAFYDCSSLENADPGLISNAWSRCLPTLLQASPLKR